MADKTRHAIGTCDSLAVGSRWYKTAAEAREHVFPPFVYVYRCLGCDGWYITSSSKSK